ncbi:DUF447 domain-containing protein [Methanonatronarchaeum sp. AMET6-2]|uniref:DUF447 domain-containing protein n=1 Tax=Methanonatronarchaeum sp. AMET6-2 TaxID=2933293 RepID=UPI0011F65424|nr:DUF447 domain-containing protein [Methanonatronarchaeum sp. AMET6-2]RZN62911.1 MAG: DUF447 family protein [Methanonatronarchaeia archaeon]UOY09842.1 DUF447 family protein [Methanonatronarchaeum sp. AMET6-2]
MGRKLIELGFDEGRVVESLLVVKSGQDFNCAPIGVWRENGFFWAKVHRDSKVHSDLSEHGACTVNIVDVPRLVKGLVSEKFEVVEGRLADAPAALELRVKDVFLEDNWARYKLSLEDVLIKDECAKGVCRAELALLESAVHATRTHLGSEHSEMIDYYREIIMKTGGVAEKNLSRAIEDWIDEGDEVG